MTYTAVTTQPANKPYIRAFNSANAGGWAQISSSGNGETKVAIPGDNNSFANRTINHEFGHANGLLHSQSHPEALRYVDYIDYRRVVWETISNWLPAERHRTLYLKNDPWNSVMAYWAPSIVGFRAHHRRWHSPSPGDLQMMRLICDEVAKGGFAFPTAPLNSAAKYIRWDLNSGAVPIVIPGDSDVRIGVASGKLRANANWNPIPLRTLSDWTYNDEHKDWSVNLHIDDFYRALGEDLDPATPSTGVFVRWYDTNLPVDKTFTVFFRVEQCRTTRPEYAPQFRCLRYIRFDLPLFDDLPKVDYDAELGQARLLLGPQKRPTIFQNGFENHDRS